MGSHPTTMSAKIFILFCLYNIGNLVKAHSSCDEYHPEGEHRKISSQNRTLRQSSGAKDSERVAKHEAFFFAYDEEDAVSGVGAGDHFCGSLSPDSKESVKNEALLRRFQESQLAEGGGRRAALCNGCIVIDTYFHIITNSDESLGYVSDERIKLQLGFLNQAFAGSPFQFLHKDTTRINDSRSFNLETAFGNHIPTMQGVLGEKLRQGDKMTLNIYTAALRPAGLGLATFPTGFDGKKDGVFLDHCTLPGGSCPPYSTGMIPAHEVGHWLGLLHVFEGGCNEEKGDHVADTPAQAYAVLSCSGPRSNSCPNLPGSDPLENFMGYSPECSSEFTLGQWERMYDQWLIYRDGSGGCSDDEGILSLELRLDSNPQDNFWHLYHADGQLITLSNFGESDKDSIINAQICVPYGAPMYFGLGDHASNGMASSPNSFFRIYFDGKPLKDDRTFETWAGSAFTMVDDAGCAPDKSFVVVELLLDRYPTETRWWIQDSRGSRVHTESEYKLLDYSSFYKHSSVRRELCLSQGSFSFIIQDSYGDGLSEAGPGDTPFFRITANGKVVVDETNFSGREQIVTFQVKDSPSQMQLTESPSPSPTAMRTELPSTSPSHSSSENPSASPSQSPSAEPSRVPSRQPSEVPSNTLSIAPISHSPTGKPSSHPSASRDFPSMTPSQSPIAEPSRVPSKQPSEAPSDTPSIAPISDSPTGKSSIHPSASRDFPSMAPSQSPSDVVPAVPSMVPSQSPSFAQSQSLSPIASAVLRSTPTEHSTFPPTTPPTTMSTEGATLQPTASPTTKPTWLPTSLPTLPPTGSPSMTASESPSFQPSIVPSESPSASPSVEESSSPSGKLSDSPSQFPSDNPSAPPTVMLSNSPSMHPSAYPSAEPSVQPSSQARSMAAIDPEFGLEELATLDVVKVRRWPRWPFGYPKDKNFLVVKGETYYIPKSIDDIDYVFDLGAEYVLNRVYIQDWSDTKISSVKVGIASDDGSEVRDPPRAPRSGWKYYDVDLVASLDCCNRENWIDFEGVTGRFIAVQLRGGSSSDSKVWGTSEVKIGGHALPQQFTPPSDTGAFVPQWGLEQSGSWSVLPATPGQSWPHGFPQDGTKLFDDSGSEYFVPKSISDVDFVFDFGEEHLIDAVFLLSWYMTVIDSIEVGICGDDGRPLSYPPNMPSQGWTFYDMEGVPAECCNWSRDLRLPSVPARFLIIRVRDATSTYEPIDNWGLRRLHIAGVV